MGYASEEINGGGAKVAGNCRAHISNRRQKSPQLGYVRKPRISTKEKALSIRTCKAIFSCLLNKDLTLLFWTEMM